MFKTKGFTSRVAFEGDPNIALSVARDTLVRHGFRIVRCSASELEARAWGMNSTKQPATRGATEIRLLVTADGIELRARLGGVAAMRGCLHSLVVALGAFAAFWTVLLIRSEEWYVCFIPAVAFAAQAAAFLTMAWWLTLRTERALDELIRVAADANPPES